MVDGKNRKKKGKRGKRKSAAIKNQQGVELYYNNINGLLSKQDSLNHILAMKRPDLVALCETKLHKNSNFEISGYENRKVNLKAGKEGILIAAKNGTFNSMELIYEAESKQIATVEIEYPKDTLRLIVAHGPQESANQEEKEEFYNDLAAEVERGVACQCKIIIAGDLNAKVEHQNGEVQESKGNGMRVKEMIDKYELGLLNIQPETEGKWTRIQRKEGVLCKSEIDYIIADTNTRKCIQKTIIDEEKILTPYRVKKEKNIRSLIFSDHCAIITSIDMVKGTSKKKQSSMKSKQWVITEEGLEKYQEITQSDMDLNLSDSSEPFDIWKLKVDDFMHQCFKKRTIKIGGKEGDVESPNALRIRMLLNKMGKRGKIQREIIRTYQQRLIEKQAKRSEAIRAENLRGTIETLTSEDKLSPNAFWKMRKSLTKNSRLRLPAVYKKNGIITSNPEEIKAEVRREFEFRLRNRKPDEEWEGYVEATNLIVEELLKEQEDESPPFTFSEMKEAIGNMKNGISPDYYGMYTEILKRSGDGILKPLLQVLNTIKANKKIPEMWRKVLITMIYKNKGSHLDLEKYRGIFLTVIVSKVFEGMLKGRMKPQLEKVSLFQAGSRTGKGAPDNLFLLRSSIDHSKYMNRSIYITTYDFRQAFDSLWLQDCVLVLRKLGVENYILKLIYEMNKKAVVQIKTPYGLTEPLDVTDIVKQGGILGSPMCSATTAEYCEQNKGISIGNATIASLAFVDDIADVSDSFEDALNSHKNALEFASRKKLQLAPDKCFIMLIKQRNKEIKVPELEVEGKKVQEAKLIKYLGDFFNEKGNNDDLIEDRAKRGTATTISIQGLMREASLGTHTLSVYLLLHNAIFISSVIFNSEAWSNVTEKNIATLTTIQLRYLKKMMDVRQATTNAFMYLELGILPIKYEIHKRQLSFLHHIVNLSENDPVKMVWRHQTELPDHNNWWCGVKKLMENYSIEYDEEEIKKMSKDRFKRKVRIVIRNKAFEELKKDNASKTKTKNIIYDKYETQQYIKSMYPGAAKIILKCRAKTLKIKDHMRYKFTEYSCRWCGVSDETLEHVVNCGHDEKIDNVEQALVEMNIDELSRIASRVDGFLSKIEI